MPIRFGGPGVTNTLADLTSNQFALQPGEVWAPPANGYWVNLGRYTQLQEYDPITTTWQPISGVKNHTFFSADGVNMRFANTSGCAVGALLTAAGSGYTFPPTVSFFNDPRDSTGANASAVATITGAGTVAAVLCLNHGVSTAGVVPTLTFSGGGGSSAAATAIMNFAITAYAVSTAGAGYTAAAG